MSKNLHHGVITENRSLWIIIIYCYSWVKFSLLISAVTAFCRSFHLKNKDGNSITPKEANLYFTIKAWPKVCLVSSYCFSVISKDIFRPLLIWERLQRPCWSQRWRLFHALRVGERSASVHFPWQRVSSVCGASRIWHLGLKWKSLCFWLQMDPSAARSQRQYNRRV